MRVVKTQKKQYELAAKGLLLYIEGDAYRKANVGMVIGMHGKLTFYARRES